MKGKAHFTVSGPGVDRRVAAPSVGVSKATNFASSASRDGRAETFYVRDRDGEAIGRVEADGMGGVTVFCPRALP